MGQRAGTHEGDAGADAGEPADIRLADLDVVRRSAVQPLHGNVALIIMQGRDQPGQRGQGVGNGAAVNAAMDGMIQRADFDDEVEDSP